MFIAAIVVAAGLVATTSTAYAATPVIQATASVTVSGTTATATTTVTTGASTAAQNLGVCVRDASWKNADFEIGGQVTLSATPTVVTKSKTFAPGTYYYWTCAKINGEWNQAPGYQSFQVFDKTPAIHASATVSVSGNSALSTASVTTDKAVSAMKVGVCVRDSSWKNADFPKQDSVSLTQNPTYVTQSRVFEPGTYYYWTCAQINGVWNEAPGYKTFTVLAHEPVADPAAMPVGNLPEWTQTFSDDFTTDVAAGGFPGPYAAKWTSYDGFPDTSHAGWYDQSIISAHDGYLDVNLHTRNGKALGAAPVPLVNGKWGGQLHGRFSVRMKSDSLPGFGTGFLLWNDSGDWNDGEVDFPESDLSGTAKGYVHCVGNPSVNCLVFNSTFTYTDWHTYTIEWKPGVLNFLIDDTLVASNTNAVPTKSMHWVMQMATRGAAPDPMLNGHVLLDWATIYSYTP